MCITLLTCFPLHQLCVMFAVKPSEITTISINYLGAGPTRMRQKAVCLKHRSSPNGPHHASHLSYFSLAPQAAPSSTTPSSVTPRMLSPPQKPLPKPSAP